VGGLSRSELPSGTVSLLFTDIEGSTQLLERLGRESYALVLARHRELIRAVAAASGGVEVEMQGDSFFFAFTRARDAIRCAAEVQRGIARELADEGLAVRIGIHTGEPDLAEDNLYVGIDVHRAARVMAAAHGGQVLLSEQTTRLVEGELPADLDVRVLGKFVLRGVTRPESLAQLEIAELPDTFPPPRAQAVTSRSRRRTALYIASGLVLAVLVPVIGYFAMDSGSDPLVAAANSVAVIDAARNEVVAVIGVGTTPTTIVAGGGNIWALNTGDQTISMIDEASHEFVRARGDEHRSRS
jgi:class 3 adenylate cyclase